MNKKYIILKLGGSIITRKNSSSPVFKKSLARKIGKTIKSARDNNENLRLILLHGAGSFGHPLAHKYRLSNSPVTPRSLTGIAKTITSMKTLSSRLAGILQETGIPAIPIQTSSIVSYLNNKVYISNMKFIEYTLNNNGVPLLGGDVVIDDQNCSRIISADTLVTLFAQKYPSSKILLASDVDGVYASFPPKNKEKVISVLEKSDINKVQKNSSRNPLSKDVTGAMSGKLQNLLPLNNQDAYIFNGHKIYNLKALLSGKARGTLVRL